MATTKKTTKNITKKVTQKERPWLTQKGTKKSPEEVKKQTEAINRAFAVRRAETKILEIIRDKLLTETSTGRTEAERFIDAFVTKGIRKPDSRPGEYLARALGVNDGLLQRLDKNIEKQLTQDREFLEYRLFKQFYDKQREIFYDRSFKRKLICTSRRWGKTETAAGKFVMTAMEPGSSMNYIHLNVTNAVRQMWNKVKKYSESIDLAIAKEDHTHHEIVWANGSILRFWGNNTTVDADKILGEPSRLSIIDEAGSQRWLRYLVDTVLMPMFVDYGDKGELIIQGTPPRVPKTFFEQLWNKSGYKKYTGIMYDNPFLPDPKKFIEDFCQERGLSISSPVVQREFFGAMGVYDTEAMIYKNRTYYTDPPKIKVTDITIGVDYGFRDYNAVIGLAYNRKDNKGYVFFEEKFNKSGAEFICETAKRAYEQAKQIAAKNSMDFARISIVADTNEQSITFDMMTKWKLPAKNAYKYNKEYAIELLAQALAMGEIVIRKGGPLDEELDGLIWSRDEEENIVHVIDDIDGEHPDAADALLYAYREYRHICEDVSMDVKGNPEKYLPRLRSMDYGVY